MDLAFAPGLLELSTPPPLRLIISWFEALPDEIPGDVWGIYVLVLKRPGYSVLLYIGSATNINLYGSRPPLLQTLFYNHVEDWSCQTRHGCYLRLEPGITRLPCAPSLSLVQRQGNHGTTNYLPTDDSSPERNGCPCRCKTQTGRHNPA